MAGGTGFIGQGLLEELTKKDLGHEVILLSRRKPRGFETHYPSLRLETWDGSDQGGWRKSLEGAGAVINLCGEPVFGSRWTKEKKTRILESRVHPTRALVEALGEVSKRPEVLINASAVGAYGDAADREIREDHPRGMGFLADVCEAWEEAALGARGVGMRVVLLRIGIVVARGGGVLEKFIPPFRLFVGGPLGGGLQWFPWIHRSDVAGAISFLIENSGIEGPVNCVSPGPVRMVEFCRSLGKVMKRPSWLHVPRFVLKVMMGEMAEMVFMSQRVVPSKLLEAKYPFRYPGLDQALNAVFGSASPARHPR